MVAAFVSTILLQSVLMPLLRANTWVTGVPLAGMLTVATVTVTLTAIRTVTGTATTGAIMTTETSTMTVTATIAIRTETGTPTGVTETGVVAALLAEDTVRTVAAAVTVAAPLVEAAPLA